MIRLMCFLGRWMMNPSCGWSISRNYIRGGGGNGGVTTKRGDQWD